jgi:hypothetical protein
LLVIRDSYHRICILYFTKHASRDGWWWSKLVEDQISSIKLYVWNKSLRLVCHVNRRFAFNSVFSLSITLIICCYFHIYTCLFRFVSVILLLKLKHIYTYNTVITEECGYRDCSVVVVIVKKSEKKEETTQHGNTNRTDTLAHTQIPFYYQHGWSKVGSNLKPCTYIRFFLLYLIRYIFHCKSFLSAKFVRCNCKRLYD